ncbi:MAG: FliH/SctL family protein [Rhodospirillales bacterium]
MFDTDFDELAERRQQAQAKAKAQAEAAQNGEQEQDDPEPEPEPEAPTFSEDDVARAREEGIAEGKRLGTEEAATGVDKQISDTLTAILQQAQGLVESQETANQDMIRHAVSVAAALVRKLFPTLNRQTAADQVEAMLETALGQTSGEAEIIVRVPDGLAEELHERVSAVSALSGFQGNIKIIGDPALEIGDCRLEWSTGGVARSTEELAQQLDEIVARNLESMTDSETTDAQPEPPLEQPPAQDVMPEQPADPTPEVTEPAPIEVETQPETLPDAAAPEASAPAAPLPDAPHAPIPSERPADMPNTVAEAAVEPAVQTPAEDESTAGPAPMPSEEIIAEAEADAALHTDPAGAEPDAAPIPSDDLVAEPQLEEAGDEAMEDTEESAPDSTNYGGFDLELEDDLKD